MGVATETAGYQLIRDQFVPKLIGSGVPDKVFQGYLLSSLCALAMVALIAILFDSVQRWREPRGEKALAPAE